VDAEAGLNHARRKEKAMSAAATAAGYLYASGRLRGRGAREQEHGADEPNRRAPESRPDAPPRERPPLRRPVRVAALPSEEPAPAEPPKRAPRVQYRVRRWRPGQEPDQGHGSGE
jgi:hypothetical protein